MEEPPNLLLGLRCAPRANSQRQRRTPRPPGAHIPPPPPLPATSLLFCSPPQPSRVGGRRDAAHPPAGGHALWPPSWGGVGRGAGCPRTRPAAVARPPQAPRPALPAQPPRDRGWRGSQVEAREEMPPAQGTPPLDVGVDTKRGRGKLEERKDKAQPLARQCLRNLR